MLRLIYGDCLEKMDNLINEGVKVDAIITDLPYGITKCKWDSIIPFHQMWSRLKALRKDKTPVVLFGSEPFSSALRMSNIKEFKYDWYWIKNKSTNFLNAKKQPLRNLESISIFFKHRYYYQKTKGHKPVNTYTKNTTDGETVGKTRKGFSGGGSTERYPKNTVYFNVVNNDNSKEKKIFSTQKPVDLMEYFIKTYTLEGDTVLDFTMGSGTTGKACKNLNRHFIGIEKEKECFDIAKERLKC
jgi:site-specific DNA-methyltransferase (adenine-specific)